MTPLQLWFDLTEAGFTLRLEGNRLMVSPASQLTTAQRDAIKQHRNGLLLILTPWQTTHCGLPATLLEIDADGEPWYAAWRPVVPGPLCVPCLVRGTALNEQIPFS